MSSLNPADASPVTEKPGKSASIQGADRIRALIGGNKIALVAGLLALPVSLFSYANGNQLPFVMALFVVIAAWAATWFARKRNFSVVLAIQVATFAGVGTALSLINRELVDFGMALTLLAPIHASILGRGPDIKLSWGLVTASLFVSALASIQPDLFTRMPGAGDAFSQAIAYAVAALIVTKSAIIVSRHQRSRARAETEAVNHLIEHVRDAVVRFNADGDLVFLSQSSEKLFGCRKFELAGAGLAERTHVLDRPLLMTAFSDARNKGTDRLIDVRMRKDDDSVGKAVPDFIWVEVSLSPVPSTKSDKGPYEVIAILHDITRRKRDEQDMKEAQRNAEGASEAKSQFLATIGHELRTPLNAIVGFSDMMANDIGGELPPTFREYSSLISRSGYHLLEIVNMLLDMSKIEAGRFELQTSKFDPKALVAPCIQIVSKAAQEKNIEIEVKMEQALPMIIGDERACRQIVINLLSNAIKFSAEGGKVLWTLKPQGAHLLMSVSDTGLGMDKDAIDRLGEPFFQADGGLDRNHEGTGLGVSIVKGLVQLHDGSLKVSSERGQGTTMTVLLPVNGPETKMPDTAEVTQLRSESDRAVSEEWPEQKSVAL